MIFMATLYRQLTSPISGNTGSQHHLLLVVSASIIRKSLRGQPSQPTDFTHLAFGGFGLAWSILPATEEQQRKTSTFIQQESTGRHVYRETIESETERKVYGTRKSKREKESGEGEKERERER